jgi:hypothetical protein
MLVHMFAARDPAIRHGRIPAMHDIVSHERREADAQRVHPVRRKTPEILITNVHRQLARFALP